MSVHQVRDIPWAGFDSREWEGAHLCEDDSTAFIAQDHTENESGS